MNKIIYSIIMLGFAPLATIAQINENERETPNWEEQGHYYMKKSKTQKAVAYSMMFGGFTLFVSAGMTHVSLLEDEADGPLAVMSLGLVSMISSYPFFFSGAKNKGKAIAYFQNPGSLDANQRNQLLAQYRKKSKTNAIIGCTLLGAAITAPILASTVGEGSGTSSSIAAITTFTGVFGCIPFFMASSRNKGSVTILTRTEHMSSSFFKNSGSHRSIGIGIPIGK